MVVGNIVDNITRMAETAADGVNETLFEPVVRLGVTGLSRSGKTVFITSLVANMLDRGRMPQLGAAAQGKIIAAYLQPQPDDTIPRFDYETHLAAMTGKNPHWPRSTRSISQLRLSLRVQPSGIISGLRSPRTVHIDIVDYPGEWLLDLPLLDQSFAQWSAQSIALAKLGQRADLATEWLGQLEDTDADAPLNEVLAQNLAKSFTSYLTASREAGFSACSPGRFLMPGDLQGSPVLTFAPLREGARKRGSLYREFERRFEAYKSKIVRPFFKNHFARIDRQVVLVDALGAIHAGPQAVNDLRNAMVDILSCYRIGQNGIFAPLLGKKVEKILFAATKADHLHHTQHNALTNIMQALLRDAKDRAEVKSVNTAAMAIASLRTTVEETIQHDGETLDCVRGTLLDTGKQAVMYPGELPDDPMSIISIAKQGADNWLDNDYAIMRFAPADMTLKSGDGPPHIRLDKAAEFLIGDRLK
ncbi:hypothetical protein GCM10008927_16380 [Amylibacter ulvae]|uniref:YcjX family protein n=1 Tax=Paramylibacter ulvae TaxID=1651968 RepID=A0ABQ3CZS3_9RHOB|nr:YcjX family protein [Amylibacter ulvae]GHA51667.1 hypothetical protein GCM10008927_16380 [Amylibacter ulvae]